MTYTVLDPTNEPIKTFFELAPRPGTFQGLTLGLIDNGRKNADYLVKSIGGRLKKRYGLGGEYYLKKPSPSYAISEDAARELARKAQCQKPCLVTTLSLPESSPGVPTAAASTRSSCQAVCGRPR